MSRLRLALACWDYDRTRPLLDGSVKPEGIELTGLALPPRETFSRMFRFQEFDVAEMSLANYAMLRAREGCPFVGIPAFPSKTFRHSCIYINANAGIERPEDLAGRRIGVPEYSITAAVFGRGLLHHEHGVSPESVTWLYGGQEGPGMSSRVAYALPDRIRLQPIPPDRTLSQMLETGEIDALITPTIPAPFLRDSPAVKRLFEDFKAVEMDYFRRTRIFPIMHTVVVREQVYRKHPWVARSLYEAFMTAKEQAYEALHQTDALKVTLPWVLEAVEETWRVMGRDFWAYGLEPNRPTLEALSGYLMEQGLAERVVAPEELFAPNTLD